ncbi:MAG TPA: thioredoxin family protein [Puia sp.]|jgi:thioredoxin-related protein
MKKVALILIQVIIITVSVRSQTDGIHFEHGITWKQVLSQASHKHKFIFVDCYTTWCGPCKRMMNNIFPLKIIGDKVNSQFISISIQMDTTKDDNDTVRNQYQLAHMLAKEYNINAYPTYIFFSPKGKAVHKVVGAWDDPSEFITVIDDALTPNKQLYTLIDNYKVNKKDSSILNDLVRAAYKSGSDSLSHALGNAFVKQFNNPLTKDNIKLINYLTQSSSDNGYKFFLQHHQIIDSIEGFALTDHIIGNILFIEEVEYIYKSNDTIINWSKIESRIKSKSNPRLSEVIVAKSMTEYYRWKANWPMYEKSLLHYLTIYGEKIQGYLLNNYLWDIFLHSTSREVLATVLPWSKRTLVVSKNEFSAGYDTYANLLYKLGRNDEALLWEKKGLDIAVIEKNINVQKTFKKTIDKMEKEEKTW